MNDSDLYRLCYDTKEKSTVHQLFMGPLSDQNAIHVAVLGDYAVGKTALVHRLCRDQFLAVHKPTKSVQRQLVSMQLTNGERVKLKIYDTPGCKRLHGEYLYGCKGALLLYDTTEPYSFANLQLHINEIRRTMPPDTQLLLVGTKSDMTELNKVPFATAELFASGHGLSLMEVSSRSGVSVQAAFAELAERILDRQRVETYEPISLDTADQQELVAPLPKFSFFCCWP